MAKILPKVDKLLFMKIPSVSIDTAVGFAGWRTVYGAYFSVYLGLLKANFLLFPICPRVKVSVSAFVYRRSEPAKSTMFNKLRRGFPTLSLLVIRI